MNAIAKPSLPLTNHGPAAPYNDESERARKPKMRITPYGWGLIFLLVWVPFTAITTANNFLLIVFFMLTGLILVSRRLAKKNINAMQVNRKFPDRIFADTPFTLSYVLTNAAGRDALALTFHEAEGIGRSEVRLPPVGPGSQKTVLGEMVLPTRGRHTITPGRISSGFPFGMATYSRVCGDTQSVLVFPKVEEIRREIPHLSGLSGHGIEKAGQFGTIPFSFRDYVPGDPVKMIQWKKSAQTGNLITKVLSEEESGQVAIRLPKNASERSISRAASLVAHFTERGTPIVFYGPGIRLGPGVNDEFVYQVLTHLALWDNPDEEVPRVCDAFVTVSVHEDGACKWNRL
jgi:uncharacterized protein (DUF58 family)